MLRNPVGVSEIPGGRDSHRVKMDLSLSGKACENYKLTYPGYFMKHPLQMDLSLPGKAKRRLRPQAYSLQYVEDRKRRFNAARRAQIHLQPVLHVVSGLWITARE